MRPTLPLTQKGPVALKGVASGLDAKRAVETGFKCVWVSNHGGRQLEDSVATFDVLPEVRQSDSQIVG